jgi:hypothetical protein
MKVTQTPAMPPADQFQKAKNKDAGDGLNFQGVLSKAVRVNGQADSTAPQTPAADPLAPLEGVPGVARSQAAQGSVTEEAVNRIQSALDLLDNYQQQLADPQISLKEMMPVMNALKNRIHDLTRTVDQAQVPDDLAEIASEVAVTAQVEVSKFYRGDYV